MSVAIAYSSVQGMSKCMWVGVFEEWVVSTLLKKIPMGWGWGEGVCKMNCLK